MPSYSVKFEPSGLKGRCRDNESLGACARRLGTAINSVCGGRGKCLSCRIHVLTGKVSKPAPEEKQALSPGQLKRGWRLACLTYPLDDCIISLPPDSISSAHRVQLEGMEMDVRPAPPVSGFHIELEPPSGSSVSGDTDRLLESLRIQHDLSGCTVDIDVVRNLPEKLRSLKWHCTASLRGTEVVAINRHPCRQLGLAVDLGTTKIAAYLVEPETGRILASKGLPNPQMTYGDDIISRIDAAGSPANRARLKKLARDAVNELIHDLCREKGADREEVVESVIAGNTVMHHLFVGLPVKQLAFAPFVPAVNTAMDIKARDIGIDIARGAYIHMLPNIAAFVGGDHVAMLLASGAIRSVRPVLAVDIGTNTEASLIAGGQITTVSCASGPAFEGYHIEHGMRAASGAIEKVRISGNGVEYQTVDGTLPAGICGSGLLDSLAQLHLAGIIDSGGRMTGEHPLLRTAGKSREFVLVDGDGTADRPDITVTQKDVRELQLAKAAIRTGISLLLENRGIPEGEIDRVIIAGAFGSYINVDSSLAVGMFPPLSIEKFRQVGNAAGAGARQVLISVRKRQEANRLASRVQYLELAGLPGFSRTFVESGYIGRYFLSGGKREAE